MDNKIEGPGTPSARLTNILNALRERFPNATNKFSSEPPETRLLEAVDVAIAKSSVPNDSVILTSREARELYEALIIGYENTVAVEKQFNMEFENYVPDEHIEKARDAVEVRKAEILMFDKLYFYL